MINPPTINRRQRNGHLSLIVILPLRRPFVGYIDLLSLPVFIISPLYRTGRVSVSVSVDPSLAD
jgi:hypothetical protein